MRVFVKGYFAANLGDDLFLQVLAERYPQHTFTVFMEKKHSAHFTWLSNIEILSQTYFQKWTDKVLDKLNISVSLKDLVEKEADITVIIGGSLFQEPKNKKNAARKMEKYWKPINPTFLLGANFGPYYSQKYLDTANTLFSTMDDICFRDRESIELFHKQAHIRYAPDIVFGMDTCGKNVKSKKNKCIISVIDFNRKLSLQPYAENYRAFLLRAIEYYLCNGYEVVLTSFCKAEGDENAIKELMRALCEEDKTNVHTLFYDGSNAINMIEAIQESQYIIATRFHSMILGMIHNVPVLPIVYNEKIMNVLQDFGVGELGIMPDQLNDFCFNEVKYVMIENLDAVKKEAQMHFAKLDERLKKEN